MKITVLPEMKQGKISFSVGVYFNRTKKKKETNALPCMCNPNSRLKCHQCSCSGEGGDNLVALVE